MAGRPSLYKPEIVAEICDRLSRGEPLATMCNEQAHLPAWRTVYDWMDADPVISAAIARAREAGEAVIGADCLQIADTPQEGVETVIKPDGSVEVRRGDMLGHRKLRIDTRLKLLAKWNPKNWGERVHQEITGKDGGAIQYEDTRDRNLRAIEQISARLSGAAPGQTASPREGSADTEPDAGTDP